VVPRKLNPAVKLPGPPALIVLPSHGAEDDVQVAAEGADGQRIAAAPMFLAPLKYPPRDLTSLPVPNRLLARSREPASVVTILLSPNRFRTKFP
jgi:hypothetical protein